MLRCINIFISVIMRSVPISLILGSRVSVSEFPFLAAEKMEQVLSEKLDECPEELHAELAQELFRWVSPRRLESGELEFQLVINNSNSCQFSMDIQKHSTGALVSLMFNATNFMGRAEDGF